MISPAEAKAEIQARVDAKDSLLSFSEYTHHDWLTGDHHRTICEALEAVERGDIDRLLILAPPRHGKSELSSRRFPSWYLGRNPNKQIIQAAHTAELASDFGRDVRDILTSLEYRNVFSTELHPGSRAADRWQTAQGGRYFAVGVGGALVGRGADLGVIDDPIRSWEDANSQSFRDSLWRWYTSVFLTRLMPKAAVVVCLTHWHEDDLAGRILSGDDSWHVVKLPALTDGKALWPDWYDEDSLLRWKSQATNMEWEALYQQNPQPETGTYFERQWFNRYDERPENLRIHISTDFAVSAGGGDYTELGVWGIDEKDDLYALDWWRGQTTMDKWVGELFRLHKKWDFPWVWCEKGVIFKAAESFIKRRSLEVGQYPYLKTINRSADKEAMARSFQGRSSMGKIYFPKTDWADLVINQLVGFPAGKYDDAVDACGLMGLALNEAGRAFAPRQRDELPESDAYRSDWVLGDNTKYNWKVL